MAATPVISDPDPAPQRGADVPIRVAVIATVRLYREGLASLLDSEPGITLAGAMSRVPPDPAPLSAIDPDVVLFDISPPGSLGEVRRVAAAVPAARVVALAVGESENQVVACAEAGADGYVTRDQSVEDVLAVIGAVTRGELICSPRIAGALLQRLGRLAAELGPAPADEPPVRLTAREREIVVLIDRGMSNKQIARTLTIEVATVKNHVHNILEKLHVTRRDEAVARLRSDPDVAAALHPTLPRL